MELSNELKKIKKVYGENFMHFCREMFPTILEEEGRLYSILTSTFSENCKTLYEDIKRSEMETEFKDAIYEIALGDNKKQAITTTDKTPYELLDEAGYNLFECTTQDKILAFRKYYKENEELCTFRDSRLRRCAVFFAVRKDVDKIRREDFKNPKRQDKYGTSVMSIQFEKNGVCTCSIKNRYNHTVNNPDATFGNDLDKIIPGLSNSFEKLLKQRGLSLDTSNVTQFELHNYVRASDGKYYKYNIEDRGIYYCPGNIIITGAVHRIENPERTILIDNYIVDLENKRVELALPDDVDELFEPKDEFAKSLGNIKNIKVEKDKEKGNGCRKITIWHTDTEAPSIIEINRNNQITGFTNSRITQINQNILPYSEALESLSLPSLRTIEGYQGFSLKHIDFPNLEYAGNNFLFCNFKIQELYLPKLKKVGNSFGTYSGVKKIYLPSLKEVGESFLCECKNLEEAYFPELEKVESDFLKGTRIEEINLPKIREVGDKFLEMSKVQRLYAPLLRSAGDSFLYDTNIESLSLPRLESVGNYGMCVMRRLTNIYLPKLITTESYFFMSNDKIKNAYFPQLEEVVRGSFCNNLHLKTLGLPKTISIGPNSINNCQDLIIINAPILQTLGKESLENSPYIKRIGMPALLPEYRPRVMKEHPDKVLNADLSRKIDRVLQNQFRIDVITSNDIASLDKSRKMAKNEIDSAGENLNIEEKYKNNGEK